MDKYSIKGKRECATAEYLGCTTVHHPVTVYWKALSYYVPWACF